MKLQDTYILDKKSHLTSHHLDFAESGGLSKMDAINLGH